MSKEELLTEIDQLPEKLYTKDDLYRIDQVIAFHYYHKGQRKAKDSSIRIGKSYCSSRCNKRVYSSTRKI